MTTRKEYVELLKENLDKWNTDISNWETKAKMAQTDLRIDYEMQLDALRKQREEKVVKRKALQASGEDAWQDLKAGADIAWTTMRETFDKAASHFQK